MDPITFVGVSGAAILLVGFIANEVGKLDSTSFVYDLLNLVGAGLLAWYAVLIGSMPFLILEGIWATVALRDVGKSIWERVATKN